MDKTSVKITPMLQQYLEIKSQHQDAILFYRLGDFYEMFFDDAITASKILGITLTSRSSKNDENKIPLCGIPYHSAPSYLSKLVNAGFRVAVCEQVEDPRTAKGVVKREVVRVVTPGLVTEESLLDDKSNRYVAAVCHKSNSWGASFFDISTGEFLVAERQEADELIDEIQRMSPSELIVEEKSATDNNFPSGLNSFLADLFVTYRPDSSFHFDTAKNLLLEHFHTTNLAGFGCDHMTAGISAAGSLLQYIKDTQKAELAHVEKLAPLDLQETLMLDEASRRNLELIQTIIGAKREGSLLATLDKTRTPMGARLLKKNILFPLLNVAKINSRLETVEHLYTNTSLREGLQEVLSRVYDIERLNSRIVMGTANARDLTSLKLSISQLPEIKLLLSEFTDGILQEICLALDELEDISSILHHAVREDAPVTIRDGGLIKKGYNEELDEIISILQDGKSHILSLEAKERERTGIGNLKVGYNKIFGYYLEVSKGQLAHVPDYFIRKQTLVNAERFITEELKEFENKVAGAQEKRLELEYQLFTDIRSHIATQSNRIIKTAESIALLDFYACLAESARKNKYVKPSVNDGEAVTILQGRHPVIEQSLPPGRFVPNDIHLDQTSDEVLIITGPNMAGKSTVLRQTALIVLLAQMGSFVPADEATVGVVDRIFTRVGAMDNIRMAQSTFMVEMNETANILNNATEKSLVILDEIGRGTSTFDGLAIAWAVAEDLVIRNGKGIKTIFATHYHELTELAVTHDRVKNFNIAVREWNDSIIFLHKLLPGGTNRSYGIQVAALAGVPKQVVTRAKELLHNIEKGEFNREGQPRIASKAHGKAAHAAQLNLFARDDDPLRKKIEQIQPDRLSPLEALTLLYELKELE